MKCEKTQQQLLLDDSVAVQHQRLNKKLLERMACAVADQPKANPSSLKEQWVECPGFPNYKVSTFGRVMRVKSRTCAKSGAILRPGLSHGKYVNCVLCRDGKMINFRLNRLVCWAFYGPPPTSKHEAAHLDGNKLNNRLDNLMWKTRLENESDKEVHGTRAWGTMFKSAKLTPEKVRSIRVEATEQTYGEVAAKYNVSSGLISHIMNGRNWVRVACLIGLMLLCRSAHSQTNWPILPDNSKCPGDCLLSVTVEQLCEPGYANGKHHDGVKESKGARDVSRALKWKVFKRDLGKVPDVPGQFEIDHLVPIKIGGANTISNLWAEFYDGPYGAHTKDKLEDRMAALLRWELKTNGHASATIKLKEFQSEICTNWIAAYQKYLRKP